MMVALQSSIEESEPDLIDASFAKQYGLQSSIEESERVFNVLQRTAATCYNRP